MVYEQPELEFELEALEPHLDEENLDIHYNKHHPAYIAKYNAAVEGTDLEDLELKDVLMDLDSIPSDIKMAVINNGGGAWNHSFFWSILCPEGDCGLPSDELGNAIDEAFGSMEEFKTKFKEAAITVFGSGWAWLVKNKDGELEIVKTQNQDSPISKGLKPILVIDVWEHAYYLKYKNMRPDFVEAFFNVINWKKVSQYFTEN